MGSGGIWMGFEDLFLLRLVVSHEEEVAGMIWVEGVLSCPEDGFLNEISDELDWRDLLEQRKNKSYIH